MPRVAGGRMILSSLVRAFAVAGLCLVSVAAAAQKPAPSFDVFGTRMTLEISSAQTNGKSSTVRVVVPPGIGPPAHIHTREDELYVITRGHFRFWHGNQAVDAVPGTVLLLRRNEAHQWRNVGNTTGEQIMTIMPAGLERFFLEIGKRHLVMPKDGAEVIRLSNHYGITYVRSLMNRPAHH